MSVQSTGFSIKTNLSIALIVLSLLIFLSSIVAWVALDRINTNQKTLIDQALPSMRLVDQHVDASVDLIELSSVLNNLLSSEELLVAEARANQLFTIVDGNFGEFERYSSGELDFALMRQGSEKLSENIRNQIALQKDIIKDKGLVKQKKDDLLLIIEKSLIDIHLLSSEMSLKLLDLSGTNRQSIDSQRTVLTELQYEIQRIEFIVDKISSAISVSQTERDEDFYRLQLQKISNMLLSFDVESRRALTGNIILINNVLSVDDNIFNSSIALLEKINALRDIQKENLSISQYLNESYSQLSLSANSTLNDEAKNIIKVISVSKLTLVFTMVLFLAVALFLFLFFVKPRIVNRLMKLERSTRAIANNRYDIAIDTTGNDEISAMADSLAYFRNQLLEKNIVQNKLDDREKALSTIINNAVEGLFTVNIDGDIETVNPACETFLGAEAELIRNAGVERFLPDDIDIFMTHTTRVASMEGSGYTICTDREVTACRYDGEEFFASLSVSLIKLSGQQVYSCFLRDITEEYKAKETIEALVSRLVKSNADLESFAYSCSHDLQEPVRMVLSFSDLLNERVESSLDETSTRYLNFIRQGAKNAKQLIQDMLDYSRLDQVSAEKGWVTAEEIYEQVEEMISLFKEERQGTVEFHNSDEKLFVVNAQMVQLLSNLVVNGLKYNKSESPAVKVTITSEEESWLLCVSDNGMGIDPKYHKKVFAVFERLVSKREYQGSGIGLSICQKVAERHGGNIWVESQLDKGSQFFVRLAKNTEK